jgi:hypothetical protein
MVGTDNRYYCIIMAVNMYYIPYYQHITLFNIKYNYTYGLFSNLTKELLLTVVNIVNNY